MHKTDLSQSTNFGLLRHGQTVWNKEKRVQGSGNSPLTAEGAELSRQWGRYLATASMDWDLILTSPLQRARDTAKLVNESLSLPIRVEEGIREQDWGQWEGLTLEQIKKQFPEVMEQSILKGWEFRPPQGESRREVQQRSLKVLSTINSQYAGKNILTISHLGVIKTILYYIENRQFLPEEPKIIHKNRFHLIRAQETAFFIVEKNITLPAL